MRKALFSLLVMLLCAGTSVAGFYEVETTVNLSEPDDFWGSFNSTNDPLDSSDIDITETGVGWIYYYGSASRNDANDSSTISLDFWGSAHSNHDLGLASLGFDVTFTHTWTWVGVPNNTVDPPPSSPSDPNAGSIVISFDKQKISDIFGYVQASPPPYPDSDCTCTSEAESYVSCSGSDDWDFGEVHFDYWAEWDADSGGW